MLYNEFVELCKELNYEFNDQEQYYKVIEPLYMVCQFQKKVFVKLFIERPVALCNLAEHAYRVSDNMEDYQTFDEDSAFLRAQLDLIQSLL